MTGPYLHCAFLPQWELAVVAHRKINDEHVQLVKVGAQSLSSPVLSPSPGKSILLFMLVYARVVRFYFCEWSLTARLMMSTYC